MAALIHRFYPRRFSAACCVFPISSIHPQPISRNRVQRRAWARQRVPPALSAVWTWMGKLLPIYFKLYLLLPVLSCGIPLYSLQNLFTVHRLLLAYSDFLVESKKNFMA